MELIPKAKGTSPVWLHFGFIAGDDGKATDEEKPVCKLCKESVCARGGNTSNLRFHLRKHHPQAFLQLTFTPGKRKSDDLTLDDETETTPRKQQKISESFCKGTIYEKSHPRHKRLTEAVTRYLAGGMIPIYTVDNDHFINMLSQFDSRYKLPGRNYFGDTAIPQFYIEVRNKIVDELKCADYFATTTDLWSSENMVPYLGLTVHFIDRTWTLQARVLETLYFPNDHTADNIGQTLTECFANWGLSADKHVCMTTDNGSNIKKALRDLDWINLSCFGHNLHLAVNGAMNDKRISRTLGVCRTIVSTFSTSWKKRRELKEAQETLGLPKHQLITHEIWEMDIPNRLSCASSIPETKLEELRRRKSVIEQQIADRAEQLRRSQQSWQSHREYSENRVINGLTNHQLLFEQERHERLYSGLDKAQNDGYWRQSTSRLDSLEDVITQRTKDFTSNQLNFSLQRQKLTEERSRLIDARADLRERQQYHHDGLTPSISRTGRLSEPSWLYKSERELPHIAPRAKEKTVLRIFHWNDWLSYRAGYFSADSVKVMKSPHSASSFIHQTEQQLPQQITHYWMLKEKLDEEYRRLQRPYLGELGQQSYQHWQLDDYKMVRSLVEEYVEEFLDGYFELSYGALDKGTANARIEADIRERDNTTRIYREQRAFELISEEIVLQVTRQLYQQLATEVYNTEVAIENMVDTFIIKQVQAAVAEDHGTNDPTSADYEDLLRTTLRTLRHDRHINGSDAWSHTQTLSKAGTSETLESTPSADPAELLDFNPVHRGQWHEQFPSRTDSVKQNMKIYQETELQYWKNLGVVIFSLPLLKRAQGITASSVNNSQQYLALGTGHGDILIYDTKPDQWLSIRAVNNINKKDDPIIDLAWSVDDSLISSINQLGILNIWSFSSSSPVSKADLKTLGLTVNIKDPNTVPHYPTLGLTLDTDANDFVFKQGPLSEHGNDLTSGHRPMICRFCHNNVSSNEQECVCVILDNDDIIKCGLEPGEGAEDSREVAQENGNVIGQNLSAELCRDHNYPVMVLMSVGVTDHLLTLDVKGFLNTWTFTQSELSGYGWFRPLKRYKLNMKKTCYISSDSATVNVIFSDKAQHASRKELGQLREQAERDLKELRLGPLWHEEISADRKTKISIYMPQSLQVPESGCIFHVVTRQFSNGALKSYHTQMYEHTKVECSKVLCASPSPSNTELVILMLCPECKPKGACISVFVIDAVNTVITDTRFDIDLAAVEYTACLNKDVVRCCLSCLDKRTGSSYVFLSYLAKLEAYSLATRQLVLKLDRTPGFGGCIVPAALWALPEMSRVVVLNNDDAIIIVGYAQSYRSVHVLKLSCRSDGQRDAIRAALTGIQHIT